MLTEIHTKHEWRTISNKEASLLYLDVKNINQIIHTVVKCDSHDKPPPWGLCKVLTAWVNFPSSETPLPVFSQTLSVSERKSTAERVWKRKATGEGGEVWRGGWWAFKHTRIHTDTLEAQYGNNGQISLKVWARGGHSLIRGTTLKANISHSYWEAFVPLKTEDKVSPVSLVYDIRKTIVLQYKK